MDRFDCPECEFETMHVVEVTEYNYGSGEDQMTGECPEHGEVTLTIEWDWNDD